MRRLRRQAGRRQQAGFVAAIEAKDGGPLAVLVVLPDDAPTEDGSDFRGCKVAGGGELTTAARVRMVEQVVAEGRSYEVRREDDGRVVAVGLLGGFADLGEREVFDGDSLEGARNVAELGAKEIGGDRPGGEDRGVGVVLRNEIDGLLMDDDHVAIGEVVLGRKGCGRI